MPLIKPRPSKGFSAILLACVAAAAVLGAWHNHPGSAAFAAGESAQTSPAASGKTFPCPACTMAHHLATGLDSGGLLRPLIPPPAPAPRVGSTSTVSRLAHSEAPPRAPPV